MGSVSRGKHAALQGGPMELEPLARLFDALVNAGGKVHNARTVKLLSSDPAAVRHKLIEDAAEVVRRETANACEGSRHVGIVPAARLRL